MHVNAPSWDPDKLLPKEAALVAAALREKAQGRRCIVYCTFTGLYDIAQRFEKLLTDQGLTVASPILPFRSLIGNSGH